MMLMCAVPAVQQSRCGAAVQQRACGPVRTAPAGLQYPVSAWLPEHGLACQARHRRQPAAPAASTADPTTHHITAGAQQLPAALLPNISCLLYDYTDKECITVSLPACLFT